MAWISYAQALEDIHLLRALAGVHHDEGFYIDVGAWDPEFDSVTKLFYDAGWRGINIEPSPHRYERLAARRQRDVNICAAVSETPGEIALYHDVGASPLSTTVKAIAEEHEANHHMSSEILMVKAVTLTQICADHAPANIHFLKIDVEGAEATVLRSLDLSRYRPWFLCIECHYPMRTDLQTYDAWEPYLCYHHYRFVFTDKWRINRYYVTEEHAERANAAFAVPADFYIPASLDRRVRDLEAELEALRHK
jgi:FkbM family methyltransferase